MEMKQCEIEIWKVIKDYNLYEVSNYGRVRRIAEGKNNLLYLKPTADKVGYMICNIKNEFGRKSRTVHRLVMETFNSTYDANLEVNHKDCNKSNNHIDNLEWVTRKRNLEHAEENGRMDFKKRCGEDNPLFGKKISEKTKINMSKAHNKNGDHPNYILTYEQVLDIKKARYNGATLDYLSKEYDKSEACISLICRGKRRSNIGIEYTLS